MPNWTSVPNILERKRLKTGKMRPLMIATIIPAKNRSFFPSA